MTTVEIPTSLVATVAVYFAGMYAAFVITGRMSRLDDCDDLDAFAAVFWPVALACATVVVVAAMLVDGCRVVAERFPGFAKWTKRILSVLTLPFRPWRIGHMLRRQK